MYANINDAWNTTSIFPEYTEHSKDTEFMGTAINDKEEKVYEHFDKHDCNDYLEHVMNCSKCYNYIYRNKSKNYLTDDIKEIIMVVLIGIIIIFIIDLFVKGLKKN